MWLLRRLILSILLPWIVGCSSFHARREPLVRERPASRPQRTAPITPAPSAPPRSVPVPASRQPEREPRAVTAPTVTLDNSDAARADAERVLEDASARLAHINRAALTDGGASTYQQANELISAAQRAIAEDDYLAASSLAKKASAMTRQLSEPVSR
jgi:hypothetical protein